MNDTSPALIKPNFVPTEVFYKTLQIYMFELAEGKRDSDLSKQFIALSGIIMLTSPFIKEKFKKEVLDQFRKIENLMQMKSREHQIKASRELFSLSLTIMDYSKHILLPHTLDDADEEIDWDSVI
jgi:hypothetical protein